MIRGNEKNMVLRGNLDSRPTILTVEKVNATDIRLVDFRDKESVEASNSIKAYSLKDVD